MEIVVSLIFILGVSHAVPSGYIVKVVHDCGTLGPGGSTDGAGANVTIKSDLHAMAKLTCNDGSGLPLNVEMPPIDDTNTMTTVNLYYTGDSIGVTGRDCFFFHPHGESNVYVVIIEVFWGFNNASLMEDYETYTLTCTVDGDATQQLAIKSIDENRIMITDGFVQHLGNQYSGTSTLRLMDVLGKEIVASTVPMGKKFYLELSISGCDEGGLTPYDCIAQNSDGTKTYKMLNAGCGDGIIFKKNAGFIVKGQIATSPFFKAFKIIEGDGNIAAVQYSCSFTTCNSTCDGSSCTLPLRRKRSVGEDTDIGMVSTRVFKLHHNQENQTGYSVDIQSKQRLPSDYQKKQYQIAGAQIILLTALSLLSLAISLYSCTRKTRIGSMSSDEHSRDRTCTSGDICPCPECPRKFIKF